MSRRWFLGWKQRFKPLPLFIAEFMPFFAHAWAF
jgi:hypothetical protein